MTSIILLHMLALGQIIPPVAAPLQVVQLEQVVTPVRSVQSVIQWTPSKLNQDGTPLTDLKGYLFSVAPDGVDLNTGAPAIQTKKVEGIDLPACAGDLCEFPSDSLFEDLTPGSYRVWAQAYNTAGDHSNFSIPTAAFVLSTSIPMAPAAVQVNVKVVVEIRVSAP